MTDFTYQALGAGVQSTTMTEMIVKGELPRPDVSIFADTGDEPANVYENVEYLRTRLATVGVPLVVVSAGNIVEDAMSPEGRFAAMPLFTKQYNLPLKKAIVDEATDEVIDWEIVGYYEQIGRLRRQCTSEYKVEPIEKEIRRRLLGLDLAKRTADDKIRIGKDVEIECWLGLSWDEMGRMTENPVTAITNRYPLVDLRMTRHGCKLWLRKRGLPVPGKSACRVCPFHGDAYWREMQATRYPDWQHVVEFDAGLRNGNSRLAATAKGEVFLHRQCVPLDEVDLRMPQDHGQRDFFDICGEGYCGL